MPSSACKKCARSEEHTSELQSHDNLVCRLLLEKTEDSARRSSSPSMLIAPGSRGGGRPAGAPRRGRTGGGAPGLPGVLGGASRRQFFLIPSAPPRLNHFPPPKASPA